jgi:sn-glycerol 3-phosphate transport system substrate-binding protein
VWIHVENVAAWHNEPFALAGAKGEGPLAINGLLEVKHLAMMVSWHKSRYLHVFGRGDQGDHKFAAGQCAVLTSDSSAFPQLAAVAKFDIGVATLPYHDDIRGAPQNTLADGPNLWVAAGRKPAEYAAAARFVAFLLTPEIQIEIQRRTGALPLNRAGVFAAAGSSLLANELPHIRVALQQLSYKPVTAASRRMRLADRPEVRDILAEELEALWADRKPAKEALDSAVSRSRAIRCC